MDTQQSIILAIIVVIVVLPIIIYELLALLKKIKKARLVYGEKSEDEAYNQIHTTENLVNMFKNRGYNMDSVDSIIAQAKVEFSKNHYIQVTALCDKARTLIKSITANSVEPLPPHSDIASSVIEEINKISNNNDKTESDVYLSTTYKLKKQLPENYLSAKFSISMVERKLEELHDQNIRNAVTQFLGYAKENFAKEKYTEALRYSVKANKLLQEDINTPVESELLHCPVCGGVVFEEDNYCRNCGTKIQYKYYCPECGGEVEKTDKFCKHCGIKLTL